MERDRTREHLTEAEVDKLLAALKRNRHGHRDWLIGLLIFRHGLRVSEACDLRWDDIDLKKRTIILRRLKGSTDSSHYLERDEHRALGELWRSYAAKGIKTGYVFVNERGHPFGRMGIGRMKPLGCRFRFTFRSATEGVRKIAKRANVSLCLRNGSYRK